MGYILLADAVALLHALFVLFVIFGALLALRWPRAIWAHAPALGWGLLVECTGLICPLTPLENRLRVQGGEAGYTEDFLSHCLLSILYPEFLTRELQFVLGGFLLLLNLSLYAWIWRKSLARCTGSL